MDDVARRRTLDERVRILEQRQVEMASALRQFGVILDALRALGGADEGAWDAAVNAAVDRVVAEAAGR